MAMAMGWNMKVAGMAMLASGTILSLPAAGQSWTRDPGPAVEAGSPSDSRYADPDAVQDDRYAAPEDRYAAPDDDYPNPPADSRGMGDHDSYDAASRGDDAAASNGSGAFDEEAAADRCAGAAEQQGQSLARIVRVSEVDRVDGRDGEWTVEGRLAYADSYLDRSRRDTAFRCILRDGSEPDVQIDALRGS
jgi:hypothetical protein